MSYIISTGSYLPNHSVTNEELSRIVETNDEWIFSRTGIKSRHIAKDEGATDMATKAAIKALEAANISPDELGLIVAATFTANELTPSMGCSIMKNIGASCAAFDVNAACSGFIYALAAATAMLGEKPALVVASEKLSLVTNWADRNTCVLFGDGAGAAVVSKTSTAHKVNFKILKTNLNAYPDEKNSLCVMGVNSKDETYRTTDSFVSMNGAQVYKFATKAIVKEIETILGELDLKATDISYFVPHQANVRIIDAASQKLGVPASKFYTNIEHTGNTSCASVPVAMDEMLNDPNVLLKKGDKLLLVAFGGGLTSASSVLEVI